MTSRLKVYLAVFFCLVGACLSLIFAFWESPEDIEAARVQRLHEQRGQLSTELGPRILNNDLPTEKEINWDGEQRLVKIDYTLDSSLQEAAEKLLKSYKPDYGAIVMMDAITGRILALASYEKNGKDGGNMALKGTFPAASIFKIVTASAALDKYHVSPDTMIMFNGGNHTLYKKNVMNTKINRWTREMTLREAFARSVNTVFGRLTLEHLQPQDLEEYAIRFGFNQNIKSDLPFENGFTEIPEEKNYELTEVASGFTRVTRMSPLQGAMIAAAIADDGRMRVPYIVDRVTAVDGEPLYQGEPVMAAVTMSEGGAAQLKRLMEATVKKGTSQKAFRPLLRDKRFKELELGGKTGSLTGDNPRGKVDWFVGYAIGSETDKIAIAALTVNVDFWVVKSAHLAQTLFRQHFKESFSQQNEKFFRVGKQDN